MARIATVGHCSVVLTCRTTLQQRRWILLAVITTLARRSTGTVPHDHAWAATVLGDVTEAAWKTIASSR